MQNGDPDTFAYEKPGMGINFWSVVLWVPIVLLSFLLLTVVALGVAWAFYLLIGLFP